MRVKITTKISILFILISFLFYLSSSNYWSLLQTVKAESKVSGSTIGGQEVDGLKKEEIISLLNEKTREWKATPLVLDGNDKEITLEPKWFKFNVKATVEEYLQAVEKPWFAFWEKEPTVHIPLQFTIQPDLTDLLKENPQLNLEETLANINASIGVLSEGPIETAALDFSVFESERIAFDLEEIKTNAVGLSEIVTVLNEQILNSGEVFSLLEKIDESGISYDDETADFVASLLYSVILQTNFEIIERHSQRVIPAYLEPGIEADVELDSKKDLQFLNNNEPAILKMRIEDSSLFIEIYSIPSDINVKHEIREKLTINPRTIYRYSAELKPGKEELIQEGVPGIRVAVYRTISEKKGPFEEEKLMSQDYYPPTHRVVLTSSETQGTSVGNDPDLSVDLNGDGLADIEENVNENENESESESDSTSNSIEEENVEYDKAGNIIKPE